MHDEQFAVHEQAPPPLVDRTPLVHRIMRDEVVEVNIVANDDVAVLVVVRVTLLLVIVDAAIVVDKVDDGRTVVTFVDKSWQFAPP